MPVHYSTIFRYELEHYHFQPIISGRQTNIIYNENAVRPSHIENDIDSACIICQSFIDLLFLLVNMHIIGITVPLCLQMQKRQTDRFIQTIRTLERL